MHLSLKRSKIPLRSSRNEISVPALLNGWDFKKWQNDFQKSGTMFAGKSEGMLWSLMGNTSMSWGLHISEDSNSLSLTVDFNSFKIAFLKTYLKNELKRLRPILGVS